MESALNLSQHLNLQQIKRLLLKIENICGKFSGAELFSLTVNVTDDSVYTLIISLEIESEDVRSETQVSLIN